MDNENVVHIYVDTIECYIALNKQEILSFATIWRKLEGIMLSKISQSQKDKYCVISLTCRILK
jgi:hypothetical protein